jgi:hypothetical protein
LTVLASIGPLVYEDTLETVFPLLSFPGWNVRGVEKARDVFTTMADDFVNSNGECPV